MVCYLRLRVSPSTSLESIVGRYSFLHGISVMLWVIIGDINELSSSEDKLAKNMGNSSRLNKFNNFLIRIN